MSVETRARIREFVRKNFYVPGPLGDEDSLLDRGIVDSTGVLELIGFIEGELDVRVLDEEMLPENLDSIARIDAYVERKRASAAAVG